MIIWIDAQLSPHLASWMARKFKVRVRPLKDIGLLHAKDEEIFLSARKAKAIVMTKDNDFLALLERLGPPPQIIWITCGNTANKHLKKILKKNFPQTLQMLKKGEPIVAIGGLI